MAKNNWLMVLIQALLVIIVVLYLMGRERGLPVSLFWPIIWGLVLMSCIIVFRLPRRYKIISLVVVSIGMSLVYLAAYPEIYRGGRDTVFEEQFASTIVDLGRWDPSLGTGFAQDYYGHTPVLHFLLSFSSLTTGLLSSILGRYLFFVLFRLIMAIFAFLLISTIVKSKSNISYTATLIFIGSAGMAFVGVTRRSMASVLVLLTIYTIIKGEGRNKKGWGFLFMFFSLLVVMADRSISYYLLLFLAGAWLFSKVIRFVPGMQAKFPALGLKLLYYIAVLTFWLTISSNVFIEGDIGYVADIFGIISGGSGLKSFLGAPRTVSYVNIYHTYETFIIYSAQFLFLLLGAVGLFFFIKYIVRGSANKGDNFLLYWGFFSFVMYGFSSVLMKTELDIAVLIFLWFACIPISVFGAYLLEMLMEKLHSRGISGTIAALIVIYFFTGSLLMGIYTPRITNRAPNEDIVVGLDSRSKTEELYYGGLWLSENSKRGAKLLGDIDVFEVFSGQYEFDVNVYSFLLDKLYLGSGADILDLVYGENFTFGVYEHTYQDDSFDYLIINNAFFKYQSQLFGNPIDISNLKKLDDNFLLDKIYNNNGIQIYKIERGG
jgi:hypothetical protein